MTTRKTYTIEEAKALCFKTVKEESVILRENLRERRKHSDLVIT